MNIKNRISILFLCILILGACGDSQSVVEENVNTLQKGAEEQTRAETQAEAQEDIIGEQTFYQNRWLSIKDVDWEAYQKVLSEEDYAALQGYFPVLKDEAEFIWMMGSYYSENVADKRTVTLDEFRYVLNNEIWDDAGFEPDDLGLNSIALCDLDGDGKKELILLLENMGHYLIFKQEDGTYYGTDKMYRAFEELQTNGIYIGSGGAATVYYYRMDFEEGEFREALLGYMDWGQYYAGGEKITDEEAFQEWVDSIMSGDVIYYEPEAKTGDLGQSIYPSTNDVDWEAYRLILSDEDYAILQKYFPVLREEASFTWTDLMSPDEDEVEKRTVTLAEFANILNYDLRDSDELQLDSLTLCDVDRDGKKELILYLENQEGIFLILKEKDGTYYGTHTVLRRFEALQTNGVYVGSDGAEDNYFLQMRFADGVFYETVLGRAYYGHYKMGDEETTDIEVFRDWLDGLMPGDMLYYKPQIKTGGSQAEYISIDIHNEEEYQELLSRLEGYSGYFSLDLYMEDRDILVCLDDIIAGRNLIYLEIENGGRITAGNILIC